MREAWTGEPARRLRARLRRQGFLESALTATDSVWAYSAPDVFTAAVTERRDTAQLRDTRSDVRDAMVTEWQETSALLDLEPSNVETITQRLRSQPFTGRFCHQPNSFAGINVLSSPVALARTMSIAMPQLPPVVVVIWLDYDDASDQRFRVGLVPQTKRDRSMLLHGSVKRRTRRQVAASLPAPNDALISDWMTRLRHSLLDSHRALRRVGGVVEPLSRATARLDWFGERLRVTRDNVASLTEFNAIANAIVLTEIWAIPLVVVRASRLLQRLAMRIEQWMTSAPECLRSFLMEGWWRICPVCYARCAAKLEGGAGGWHAVWRCSTCTETGKEYFDLSHCVDSRVGPLPAFVPRVDVDTMIDTLVYGYSAGVHYGGAIGHMVRSRRILAECGVPVPPELFWETDMSELAGPGLEQIDWSADVVREVTSGRIAAIWYSLLIPPHVLVKYIERKAESGDSQTWFPGV